MRLSVAPHCNTVHMDMRGLMRCDRLRHTFYDYNRLVSQQLRTLHDSGSIFVVADPVHAICLKLAGQIVVLHGKLLQLKNILLPSAHSLSK